jgi:predicted nucleic acid-binding protein
MPVIDTEVLFAMNPKDPKHNAAKRLFKQTENLKAPDTALLEFQLVLRARGRKPRDTAHVMHALRKVLSSSGVVEVKTINANHLALQGEIEASHGLSYFDSLIAASAIVLGEKIVTDDRTFDTVPNLLRIPLTK